MHSSILSRPSCTQPAACDKFYIHDHSAQWESREPLPRDRICVLEAIPPSAVVSYRLSADPFLTPGCPLAAKLRITDASRLGRRPPHASTIPHGASGSVILTWRRHHERDSDGTEAAAVLCIDGDYMDSARHGWFSIDADPACHSRWLGAAGAARMHVVPYTPGVDSADARARAPYYWEETTNGGRAVPPEEKVVWYFRLQMTGPYWKDRRVAIPMPRDDGGPEGSERSLSSQSSFGSSASGLGSSFEVIGRSESSGDGAGRGRRR